MKRSTAIPIVALWLALSSLSARSSGGDGLEPKSLPLVSQWDIHEIELHGPADGNPFVDVELSARFTMGDQAIDVAGFYDGGGVYRVRFMTLAQGPWHYQTRSNRPELTGHGGDFICGKPSPGNHGPVRVRNTYHFAYADGQPFIPIGTTCYAWIHQGDTLEEQTLATLQAAPFNKLRMCVFPKHYAFNKNEPVYYPYEGTAPDKWDFSRFNPAFFRHLEKRVAQLRDLGIEADLILFHPYDGGHWGFDRMPADADERYLRYVTARLGAYRNVWWSLANEWDFMKTKKDADWDRFFQIVQKSDPFDHLRSIHNGSRLYNQTKPWVTHASIQNGSAVEEPGRAVLYRDVYCKPIVFDEVKYEGNIEQRWGRLSAEEMVHRFWVGTIAGTYVGHGETYLDPQEILWWSKGGVLHGGSISRIAFLRKVMEAGPAEGLEPVDKWDNAGIAGRAGEYYLVYFGREKPAGWTFNLPKAGLKDGMTFQVDRIDAWDMTITPVEGTFTVHPQGKYRFQAEGAAVISLPSKPYMAIRIRRLEK